METFLNGYTTMGNNIFRIILTHWLVNIVMTNKNRIISDTFG